MQFRLRTLLILLAVLPPALAGWWFHVANMDRRSFVVLLVCLLVGIAAAGPILVMRPRRRD
jgi:hypothetical protein